MFLYKLMVLGTVLILILALNGCMLISNELKSKDMHPTGSETVSIENTGKEVEEWGSETEDETYLWMSLGSSQCVF